MKTDFPEVIYCNGYTFRILQRKKHVFEISVGKRSLVFHSPLSKSKEYSDNLLQFFIETYPYIPTHVDPYGEELFVIGEHFIYNPKTINYYEIVYNDYRLNEFISGLYHLKEERFKPLLDILPDIVGSKDKMVSELFYEMVREIIK